MFNMIKKKTVRVTVYIPIEINTAIATLAQENPVLNKNDIIKLALAEYVSQNKDLSKKSKNVKVRIKMINIYSGFSEHAPW